MVQEHPAVRSTSHRPGSETSYGSGTISARARRIVVVEDHADTLRSLCALLEMDGHTVYGTANGVEGLHAILDGTYEIALVDLNVPGMNGYDLARNVRRAGKHIPLIALTGQGLDSDRELAMEVGFDAFILKPLSPQALIALVTDPPRRN